MRGFFDGQFFSIGTNLDWVSHSLENFSQDSPLFSMPATSIPADKMQGVLWPKNNLDDKFQALFAFDIWHGLSFYKRHQDFIECWEFSASVENQSVYGVYGDKRDCLEAFIRYFNIQAAELLAASKNLPMPRFDVNIYSEQSVSLDCNVVAFLKDINQPTFSKREIECLGCIKQGKRAKEIARFLSLSPRTIEFYIQNIKKKTGVSKVTGLYELMSI